ncbi:MAG TPA: hypothetical protein VN541_08245 [Tepidisphaeraceae bacterium]|nr:hypothetical protein [Tepidisphaeraceae bacterium]
MLRKTILSIVLLVIAGLSSCDKGPPPIPVDWKWVWVGSTTAWYATRDTVLGAVVWVDRPGQPSGEASWGQAKGEVKTNTEGIVVKIECHFGEDSSTATIDGKSYDLTKGAVFLVSTHQVPYQVRQLPLNLTGYPAAPTAVQALANNSPDVAAFVAAAAAGPAPTTSPIGPPVPQIKH